MIKLYNSDNQTMQSKIDYLNSPCIEYYTSSSLVAHMLAFDFISQMPTDEPTKYKQCILSLDRFTNYFPDSISMAIFDMNLVKGWYYALIDDYKNSKKYLELSKRTLSAARIMGLEDLGQTKSHEEICDILLQNINVLLNTNLSENKENFTIIKSKNLCLVQKSEMDSYGGLLVNIYDVGEFKDKVVNYTYNVIYTSNNNIVEKRTLDPNKDSLSEVVGYAFEKQDLPASVEIIYQLKIKKEIRDIKIIFNEIGNYSIHLNEF
ncbi:MAG: hypothetical protein R2771_14200 [Saprospiraceae bacterium]